MGPVSGVSAYLLQVLGCVIVEPLAQLPPHHVLPPAAPEAPDKRRAIPEKECVSLKLASLMHDKVLNSVLGWKL